MGFLQFLLRVKGLKVLSLLVFWGTKWWHLGLFFVGGGGGGVGHWAGGGGDVAVGLGDSFETLNL